MTNENTLLARAVRPAPTLQFTPNTTPLSEDASIQLADQLEMKPFKFVAPLFQTFVQIAEGSAKHLQLVNPNDHEAELHTWIIGTNNQWFLAAGILEQPFEQAETNDPFAQNEALAVFSESIKLSLGFSNATLHVSDNGYFHADMEVDQKKLLFFFYQL